MLITGGISDLFLSIVSPFILIHARFGANPRVVPGSCVFPRPNPSLVVDLILTNRARLGRALSWRVITWVRSLPRLFAQLHGFVGRVQRDVSVQRDRA